MRSLHPVSYTHLDVYKRQRLGMACDCDLIIREETGAIESITLPGRGGLFGFRDRDYLTVPWDAVKKIGSEVIIMDLDETLG